MLFHALLISGNHLLNHLTAYGTCLLARKVTIVTLLQVNAYFRCQLPS